MGDENIIRPFQVFKTAFTLICQKNKGKWAGDFPNPILKIYTLGVFKQ